ncbi:MAG: glycosyltransferase [Candidatus Methanoperedens sp.]
MTFLDVLLVVYIAILFTLFIYGSNCFVLTYLHSRKRTVIKPNSTSYPTVTVQLPVYNELYVVERLIRKVAGLNYPKELLEIQVLDDSTDETTDIIQRCVREFQDNGLNIYSLHRTKRDGYKAGRLRRD